MDNCCNTIVGGEIFIVAIFPAASGGGHSRYEGLGDVRIQTSRIERVAGASSAGTLWVTEVSRPARALLTFINRCKSDPMLLFKGRCQLQITIVEKGRGIQHDFMNAIIVGLPEVNLSNGEITGMEIVSDSYTYNSYSNTGEQAGALDQAIAA